MHAGQDRQTGQLAGDRRDLFFPVWSGAGGPAVGQSVWRDQLTPLPPLPPPPYTKLSLLLQCRLSPAGGADGGDEHSNNEEAAESQSF